MPRNQNDQGFVVEGPSCETCWTTWGSENVLILHIKSQILVFGSNQTLENQESHECS